MISARDVVAYVGDALSRAYDIPLVLDEDRPFGWGQTVVDGYSMTAQYVQLGCASSGVSYECDVCSGVIAAYHEFRHVAQLMALHDDSLRLSRTNYSATSSVCESFAATSLRRGYYDANYRSLPHELDAERHGTRLGLRWVEKAFGGAFAFKGMKERLEHMSQDVYPINLGIARRCADSSILLTLFDTRFSPSFLSFASSHLRDLVKLNVEDGLMSMVVEEKLSLRRSHGFLYGGKRIDDVEVASIGSRQVDDELCP